MFTSKCKMVRNPHINANDQKLNANNGFSFWGGCASTDASGSALRLREEGAEATTPALTELAAVVTDGAPPADGGSPKGAGLMPAADPAPGECL